MYFYECYKDVYSNQKLIEQNKDYLRTNLYLILVG